MSSSSSEVSELQHVLEEKLGSVKELLAHTLSACHSLFFKQHHHHQQQQQQQQQQQNESKLSRMIVELDHVCYRVNSLEDYVSKRSLLLNEGTLLTESMIASRPICIFQLHQPFVYEFPDTHEVFVVRHVELPAPKIGGREKIQGWEHVECVLTDDALLQGTLNHNITNSESEIARTPLHNKPLLEQFITNYPKLPWDTRAIDKVLNADVSLAIGIYTVKFHVCPINKVIDYEQQHGFHDPVPPAYFDQLRADSATNTTPTTVPTQ